MKNDSSATRLRKVIGAQGDLVFIIDTEGRFADCFNADGFFMLMEPARFMGRRFAEVLPPDLAESLSDAMRHVAAGPRDSASFEYELDVGAGATGRFSCVLTCFREPDSGLIDCYIAVVRDISVLSRQSDAVVHKEQTLMASARANEELLKNRNIVQAAGIGLRQLGLAMKVDRCYLFRNSWSEEAGEYVSNQLLEWNNDFVEPQINNPNIQNVPFSASYPFMEYLKRNEPFCCIVSALPPGPLYELLAQQEIRSLVALPVWVAGEFWGFVGFDDCRQERQWSDADVSILASFATAIATAITRRHIEDDLERSKIEAEKANSAKSAFLSNITHEIRTPLHGVIGYAEMLSAFVFPQPEDEYFRNLKLSAGTLYELINNILDFSKIEAGVFEMSPENFLLSDIIESAGAAVSYLLKVSGNQLLISKESPDIPDVVFVDATRLKQVLVNLLSNAAKFSSDSTVELELTMVPDGLRFSVRDHGIGISDENLRMLFRPFSQFDSSLSKKYQGTGLGLSITRYILEQMGSAPRVSSRVGHGSEFSFVLPRDKIERREIESSDSAQAPDARSTSLDELALCIMVVEDNRLNMKLAETVLLALAPKLSLYKAANGMEAVHLIESGIKPHLILMDLQMPVMDGFETTRIIRDLYHEPLSIVALTASALSDVRDRCLQSGMNDFLAKPFTRDQVAQLLRKYAGLN